MLLFKPIIKLLAYLIYSLPFAVQDKVGWFIGFLWVDVFRIRRNMVISHVKKAMPELSEVEAKKIAKASVYNLGKTIAEYSNLYYWKKQDFEKYFEFEGEEILKSALAEGHGVLLLASHLGNGDLAAAYLAQMGYPIHLITKKFKSEWLDKMWNSIRSKQKIKMISDRRTQYEILQAIKKNEMVTFVLDQYMGKPLGVKSTFFGIPTGTAMGLSIFHKKTGAPVLPIFTYRVRPGLTRLVVRPPILFEDKGDDTISFMTQKYTDCIESIVRQYPEQWMWVHRRWKDFGN